jgi:hypothetical protein
MREIFSIIKNVPGKYMCSVTLQLQLNAHLAANNHPLIKHCRAHLKEQAIHHWDFINYQVATLAPGLLHMRPSCQLYAAFYWCLSTANACNKSQPEFKWVFICKILITVTKGTKESLNSIFIHKNNFLV